MLDLLPKELPEYGICHGDLHLRSILFQDDDTPTLIDFEAFGYGWRAYDLSVFGCEVAGAEWTRKAKANRTRRWNLFLKGYEEHRSLSDAEHEALKIFPPIRRIWLMGIHATGSARWGRSWINDEYFDATIQYMKNWIEYYKVL